MCRRLGAPLCGLPNCPALRRPYPPGEHGRRRRRLSEYQRRLVEKQKLRSIYGVRERQLRRLFGEAQRRPGRAGETLLVLLERRLDNLVRRLGFARTIRQARQLVTHGHVLVDDQRVDRPGYLVRPGERIQVRTPSSSRSGRRSSSHRTSPATSSATRASSAAGSSASPTPERSPTPSTSMSAWWSSSTPGDRPSAPAAEGVRSVGLASTFARRRWRMRVQDYRYGRIVVDGREERNDVILTSDGLLPNWWRDQGHALSLDDLGAVLDAAPDVLVVGTGTQGNLRPNPGLDAQLEARGIALEAAPTGQAVERYNQLQADGGTEVSAALHLTC
jgi:small subunit ribosomal protein S4